MNDALPNLIQGEILLVDDEPDNIRLLSSILVQQGHRVRRAINGRLALMSIAAEQPDLILLDVNMPGVSGYEVCRSLKHQPHTCDIPIVFISAQNGIFDKVEAFKVGGADYITKPFHIEEVLARIQHQLTIRQQRQQLMEQNQRLHQEICDRKQAEASLRLANLELQRLATRDGLTQIANRRCFDEYLHQEWKRLQRERAPLSLILCDIDHFKLYNDHYGHQAGDNCLQQVAQVIERTVHRPADLVARYGGEEFAVILPNTDLNGATHIAEQIQHAIAALHLPHLRSRTHPYLTLSMGIASIIVNQHAAINRLITEADRALYSAKAKGRNTYCTAIVRVPTFT